MLNDSPEVTGMHTAKVVAELLWSLEPIPVTLLTIVKDVAFVDLMNTHPVLGAENALLPPVKFVIFPFIS